MKWLFAGLCLLLCLSADPVQMMQTPFSAVDTLRLRIQNGPVKDTNYAHR